MTEAPLLPYAPLHVLKPVGHDLWLADGGQIAMSTPLGRVPFTIRMVVIRLASGGLWLWSPVEPEPDLLSAVAALGPVAHIMSPNAIHYAHIPAWSAAFPTARVWASPGVRARARAQGIAVTFTDDLGPEAPGAWATDLDQTIFEGSRILPEVVFHHRASQTLILADLIENFEPARIRSRWFRGLARLAGALDPHGSTPRDLRLSYLFRRDRARTSLKRLLDWAPERVILAHGRCYEANGSAELRRALRWIG